MIEIEIKDIIEIDEQELCEEECLTKHSNEVQIRQGVADYISGLDDYEYYALKDRQDEIVEKIKEYLRK